MCPLLSCPLFLFHLGSFVHCLLVDLLGVPGPHSSNPLSLQLKDSRVPWKTPLTQRLWVNKHMSLTWLLRGDAFCSLGYLEGQSLWPSDRLSHCVSQVHDHLPQGGTMASRVQQRQASPPRQGRGAEEKGQGRGTGRTVRGCWLTRKMWVSIWWGAHWIR